MAYDDNDQSVIIRAWVENHYGVEAITGPDLVEIGKTSSYVRYGIRTRQLGWIKPTSIDPYINKTASLLP